MKPCPLRALLLRALFVFAASTAFAMPVHAARVGVLANKYATETAADFNSRIPSHVFTAVETSSAIPTLPSLANFDVLLVFEDSTYGNATAVGNVAAAFANSGRAVVLGAFYDQDRSDGPAINSPHGWGALEQLDPNTTDGTGTPYAPRTLDVAKMLAHPLTVGLSSLTSAKFAGGNQAKAGSIVVANWTQPNAKGGLDPAIAYRITDNACVFQLGIAPNYAVLGVSGTDYSGDFHMAWKNAFDFGAKNCAPVLGLDPGGTPANVPTLSQWGLVLTVLLLALAGGFSVRRRRITR
jgi:hypothetical protein